MIDTAIISRRLGELNRSYVDKLYEEADRIRTEMEREMEPAVLAMFEQQLDEMERRIEALEDDQIVTEDDLLDFAFWYVETYAILSFFLRRWVIIGYRFGGDVMGYDVPVTDPGPARPPAPGQPGQPGQPAGPAQPGGQPGEPGTPQGDQPAPVSPPIRPTLPPIGVNDGRVTALVEQMREVNDHITMNTREEVRTYLQGIEALFGRDMKTRTRQIIDHFRQYFQRRGTSISELNANAAFLRGYLSAMIAAGVQKKQWVSQRDATVRTTHVAADGQIVPIRGLFIVGDALLLHPADPNAPLKEKMSCRCFMVPVAGVPFPVGPQPNVGQ